MKLKFALDIDLEESPYSLGLGEFDREELAATLAEISRTVAQGENGESVRNSSGRVIYEWAIEDEDMI